MDCVQANFHTNNSLSVVTECNWELGVESEILVMFCISPLPMESQFIIKLNEVYPLGSVLTGLLLAYIISIIIVHSILSLAAQSPYYS